MIGDSLHSLVGIVVRCCCCFIMIGDSLHSLAGLLLSVFVVVLWCLVAVHTIWLV